MVFFQLVEQATQESNLWPPGYLSIYSTTELQQTRGN